MSQDNNIFIIPVATIESFKFYYKGEVVEFCCSIDVDYNTNTLSFNSNQCWEGDDKEYVSMDGTIKYRGQCVYYLTNNQYPSFIFHTHPQQSYPWPSKEDILKLFKHHDIKASIILTNIGIWILNLPQTIKKAIKRDFWIQESNIFDINKYYYMYGKYFEYFNIELTNYFKQFKGRLDVNFYNIINYINNKMFLNIQFVPYDQLQNPIKFNISN